MNIDLKIKRDRRTKKQVNQLDDQIVNLLQKTPNLSVTSIFSAMTDPRLPEPVEKSERGYRHVQSRCVLLRRSGRVSSEVVFMALEERAKVYAIQD